MTPGRRRFYEEAGARWLRPVPDGLLRLAYHASATRALLRMGDGALAPGSAHVSAIVALRSAATTSGSHAEFTGKWHALGTFGRVVPASVRQRFARLCEAARQVEVGRRLADGLSVEPSGLLPGPRPVQVARRVDPVAVDLYADVLWLGESLGRVRSLLADVEAEADELDRRGLTVSIRPAPQVRAAA